MRIRLATRSSPLALAQTHWTAGRLRSLAADMAIEIVPVKTAGDLDLESPLHQADGKGLFTREIDAALLEKRADCAVHSLKDLPVEATPGLALAAVPERASADDVLVVPAAGDKATVKDGASPLDAIPQGATIASGSRRRQAQFRRARPDLKLVDVRGNVETRIRKMEANGWAGTVLAEAGLVRLGLKDKLSYHSLRDVLLPAAGQGALGIVARAEDRELLKLLSRLEESAVRVCVEAERAFLHHLGAGCHTPAGVRSSLSANGALTLSGGIFSLDGRQEAHAEVRGAREQPIELGCELALKVLELGGRKIMADLG